MRVTDKGLYDRGYASVAKAREGFAKATDELSSGLRVQHAWDDPASSAIAITRGLAEQRQTAIDTTLQRTTDELQATDNALDSVNLLLTRSRELAVQLSNDTYSAADRLGTAEEISALRQSLVALSNTEMNGRYIFGGNRDRTPPFSDAGVYSGDSAVRQVEIAPGTWSNASLPGDAVFTGAGGGTDLFATLSALETALRTNDVTSIRNSVTGLDAATSQISVSRSRVGSAAVVMESAAATARMARDQATADIGREIAADPFKSATALAYAERALDAALSATSKSFGPTLLDKL